MNGLCVTGKVMRKGCGEEEERRISAALTPPAASLGRHRLDGEQAAELKVLDHRKLLQALQEGR